MEDNAFCSRWRDADKVESLLCETEDTHGLPRGSLVLWCPEAKAGMKLARVRVVWESGGGMQGPVELRDDAVTKQFQGVGKRVRTIEEQYEDLWTFWIALDRTFANRAAAIVKTLGAEIGVSCDSVFMETYLQNQSQYTEGAQRVDAITAVLRGIEQQTERALANASSLDGKPHFDEASIKSVIGSMLEPSKPKLASENPGQGGLFHETPMTDRET